MHKYGKEHPCHVLEETGIEVTPSYLIYLSFTKEMLAEDASRSVAGMLSPSQTSCGHSTSVLMGLSCEHEEGYLLKKVVM